MPTRAQGTKLREVSRPRKPTPLPWTPSTSSCFSRPEAPPLRAFGGTPSAAKVDRAEREGACSGMIAVPALVADAAGTAVVSVAAVRTPKLHPSLVPPPPVGVPRRKPAPETLPPPPVGTLRAVVVPELADVEAAPVAVEIFDSVPMLVLEPMEEPEAPRLERTRESAVESMLAVVLQASISTAKAPRVIVTMPTPRTSVGVSPASPRRRLALALGAAAAIVLAAGLAASPTASPRIEQDVARDGLSLATNLMDPVSALALTWTTQEPAPVVPALAAPLPSDDHRLALVVANPDEEVVLELEPSAQPRRAHRARRRGHAPTVTVMDTTPEPTPAPRRSSSTRRPRPVSAEELLFDGEVALRLGDAKQAYRLAKRSRDSGAHTDAASLVARSACRIGERDEAKQALRDLPLLERGAVRRDCRRSGSRIGM
jgi:hypothetical protein